MQARIILSLVTVLASAMALPAEGNPTIARREAAPAAEPDYGYVNCCHDYKPDCHYKLDCHYKPECHFKPECHYKPECRYKLDCRYKPECRYDCKDFDTYGIQVDNFGGYRGYPDHQAYDGVIA